MDDQDTKALSRANHHALEYLNSLSDAPVGATVDLETLRQRFFRPLGVEGVAADQVIDELVADSRGGIIGSAGGRFFGWVVGGSVHASLAADWLTSVWDQAAGIFAAGPAAAVAEEAAGAWLKDILGLPPEASFALLTGCQMAHVTCLAAARHGVLAASGWNVEDNGLAGSPGIRIVCGSDRHGSVERAIRLLGIGRNNVVALPVDEDSRLLASALSGELERGDKRPTIVVLQAGELNTGACDRFPELIPIAKAHNAWVHVDGAFGLWAAASLRFRYLVEGVELGDSWATDGHKWLNVPYDCGYAFVKNRDAHRASMSNRESYLTYDAAARDQMDWNPEWSRRARGFPTYAALRQLGRSGIADLVDRCCDLAHALVIGIGGLAGAEVVREPQINQGLVRFGDSDSHTDAVVERIVASGEAYFGGTMWRGRRCMRVSVSNWRTTQRDVDRAIAAIDRILRGM